MIYQEELPVFSVCWGRLVTQSEIKQSLPDENSWLMCLSHLEQIQAIRNRCCQRCHNQQDFGVLPKQPLFGLDCERIYCLNCLNMGRMTESTRLYYLAAPASVPLNKTVDILTWKGTLSPEQDRASQDLIASLKRPELPHMIHAVTGAGKTEMIFPVIKEVLVRSGRVAVVSPRIDVCLELAPRLQEAFANVPVQLLYGGQSEPYRYTPLTVATTHQLLRFQEAFDLLIVDEVDAFPYAGDASLHYAVKRAVKSQTGKLVYLTATPDQTLIEQGQKGQITTTRLPARYHRHRLPEPTFMWVGHWRQAIQSHKKRSHLWRLINQFMTLEGVKLFFLPSIAMAESLYRWLQKESPQLAKQLACVHAKDPDRKDKVQQLRDGKLKGLITTTILERGVTFTNCHVCIIGAEDRLYTVAALVQMSGRVGRKWDYPTGELIYAHSGVSQSMERARDQIKSMNREAFEKGLVEL